MVAGREDFVRLVTKQETEDWLVLANDPAKGKIMIKPSEMNVVYTVAREFVERYKSLDSSNIYRYYEPALNEIEKAYKARDFDGFKKGLDSLLGLIGMS